MVISPLSYAWYPLQGFPEIGYGLKGYPIEGTYSQYVEVAVFPYIKKYGIMFYNDGVVTSPDYLKITIDICGEIKYGITRKSQIVLTKKWSGDPLLCVSPLFISVQSDKTNTTIYRFEDDN